MLDLYRLMYLIRSSEISVQKHYNENEMKTPMHMSMGSEAAVVGVCTSLNELDQVLGTYRSHALYLAKTKDINGFFAEMYGKQAGCCNGRAGSMHLMKKEFNHFGSSAIVGTNIPVAAGLALSNKMKNNGRIAASFFGDGALDEGSFWETLNFSCVQKLPILFVCEDNELAVHAHKKERQGYSSIDKIVEQFDCNVYNTKSIDVDTIFELSNFAINSIRTTGHPSFLRLEYFRMLEHVGVKEDFNEGYRDKPNNVNDPVLFYRLKMINNDIKEHTIKEIEEKIDEQVYSGIMFAKCLE